jgi:hypothetical protein
VVATATLTLTTTCNVRDTDGERNGTNKDSNNGGTDDIGGNKHWAHRQHEMQQHPWMQRRQQRKQRQQTSDTAAVTSTDTASALAPAALPDAATGEASAKAFASSQAATRVLRAPRQNLRRALAKAVTTLQADHLPHAPEARVPPTNQSKHAP